MSKNLMWFKEFGIKDIPLVGGKNASLGEMIQNLSERKVFKEEDVLSILMSAIKEAGYIPGKDVTLSLDVAASSVYEDGIYKLGGKEYSSDDLIKFYKQLIYDFPIVSIEDGLAEDDWSGWKKLQKEIGSKITLIGDDIFVTNTNLISRGIKEKAANAVLIKPNQIGTLSATMDAIAMAKKAGWKWVVSHRSGETLDTTIADISYATGAYGLKTGSPHQSPTMDPKEDVRRVKYNRMGYLETLEQIKSKKTPIGLIILDGWGIKKEIKGNAIKMANPQVFDSLWEKYPHTQLNASGTSVGLPKGEMGGSEVGHLNIGAGRVVEQEVIRIDKEIKNGEFLKNDVLHRAFASAKKHKSNVHIIGLVSNAMIHSSVNHLYGLLNFAKKENYSNVFIHAMTDGRDSSPNGELVWMKNLDNKIKSIGVGKIATMCGRYYAMDRDNKWNLTKEAYDLYTEGKGMIEKNWKEALENSYKSGITDEFLKPVVLEKEGIIKDNDVVIFFNFRADRTRQITKAFMDKNFRHFTTKNISNLTWICMTNYDDSFINFENLHVAYPPKKVFNTLADIISQSGLKQLHIAETEKYAHVTYFFNGGKEEFLPKEERILIPSPRDVATYDLKPEMSANQVTETLLEKMPDFDFFVANFANPDIIGHTGNVPATIKAIQTVDYNLGRIIEKGKELGYTFIITADHGNAEEEDINAPEHLTSHSLSPVPFILVDFYNKLGGIELKPEGDLSNIAPTILDILGIKKPKEMISSLISKKNINAKNINKKFFIKSVEAEAMVDSRNKPTIKARIILDNNFIGDWACVPAGKSTGKGEAPVVSVEDALKNIKEIEKELINKSIFSQKEIDSLFMKNLAKWGGNTTLAVSLAIAKAASTVKGQELYEYLQELYPQSISHNKTRFLMNVFNGGLHALRDGEVLGKDKVSTQEFMINILAPNYKESLNMADKIYWSIKYCLSKQGYDNSNFGDEGGYSPRKMKALNIPNGFALTSFAYFNYLKDTGLDIKIKEILSGWKLGEIDDLQSRGKKVRDLIKKTPLPKSLEKETIEYYKELCKEYKTPNLPVAIRSSATEEDSTDASFAGMHESFLNISGDKSVLRAVKECYISLFTDRAISYRIEKGFDHTKIGLSVCVQKMVRSDLASSGVIFSCDTETNFGDVVLINSSYGLGENVVKGRVEADQFYVYEKTLAKGFAPILEKRLGRKEERLVYTANKTNSTKNIKTTKEEQDNFSLTDQEILQLARYAMIIESHYGKSMDMEFAKDGIDKKLYIVQARPETVQSRKEVDSLEQYSLKKEGKLLVKGLSIGSKISQGKVRIITDIKKLKEFKKGEVLVTYMTDPDWVPAMKLASAIITESGSRTAHAAIIGRELGVTTVVGAKNVTKILKNGQKVTVSCASGEEGKIYDGFLEFNIEKVDISSVKKPNVKIMMNVGEPSQAFNLCFIPNDGVGLAREEFIISNDIKIHPQALIDYKKLNSVLQNKIDKLTPGYKNKTDFYVDTLARGIAKIGAAFYPKDVIVRFSDFKTNEYRGLVGGDLYEPQEENPMIGWRGASRYYDPRFEAAFKLECQALKRVRDEFGLTNVIPMIPFCRTIGEAKKTIDVMESCGLKQGVNELKVYVMCEIPSNIILADEFLDIFDGMSIGSNDLTQLTLGIDRDNGGLHSIADERDEAVKKLVKDIIHKCTERNKYIGICGQAPSDYPEFARFLINEGIGSISLNPDSVLKIMKALE